MTKKFAISFIWHMHQPCYKDENTGLYLMPWVRLHSVKDYLDMLLLTDEFPNIKQTFNIVPLLIDQIEDYANNEAHDIHSKYTVSDIDMFSKEDKEFILSNFFEANFERMIEPNPRYLELYNKFVEQQQPVENFTNREISDIMALFNLVWIDPMHIQNNPEIARLIDKQHDYTLEDRIKIIEIQRDIMKRIIPEYKKHLQEGKIEISTSPYYHSLLPLMINPEAAKSVNKNITLPEILCALKPFAQWQLEKSFEKVEKVFGQKPSGVWLPELCINNDTLKMLMNNDIKWTIADESILCKTLNKDISRNYRGVLDDPFDLCISYGFTHRTKEINLVFRNAFLSNLISFEYSNYNAVGAANDFYERIKVAQDKLEISPLEEHVAVIAIDGENCWENYQNDGVEFLRALYTLLNNDATLDVTTVSDYLNNVKIKQILNNVNCGSWINADLDMWIGDPTKNIAWDYLSKTKEDFAVAVKNNIYPNEVIEKAKNELAIAQGSDWFWWYGEPNNSGHDEVFDYLYRSHLKNVYQIMDLEQPEYLDTPLEVFIGKPSKHPKGLITPIIDGKIQGNHDNWANAGCIEVPQSPTRMTKMLDKIWFGNDYNNIYLRFDFNKYFIEKDNNSTYPNELFVYFAKRKAQNYSSIRLRNKNESVPQILKYVYTHEIQVPITKERILPIVFSEAIENSLWKVNLAHNINYFHSDVLEMQVPFDDLNVKTNDGIYMIFISCKANIINRVMPLDNAIYIERP